MTMMMMVITKQDGPLEIRPSLGRGPAPASWCGPSLWRDLADPEWQLHLVGGAVRVWLRGLLLFRPLPRLRIIAHLHPQAVPFRLEHASGAETAECEAAAPARAWEMGLALALSGSRGNPASGGFGLEREHQALAVWPQMRN